MFCIYYFTNETKETFWTFGRFPSLFSYLTLKHEDGIPLGVTTHAIIKQLKNSTRCSNWTNCEWKELNKKKFYINISLLFKVSQGILEHVKRSKWKILRHETYSSNSHRILAKALSDISETTHGMSATPEISHGSVCLVATGEKLDCSPRKNGKEVCARKGIKRREEREIEGVGWLSEVHRSSSRTREPAKPRIRNIQAELFRSCDSFSPGSRAPISPSHAYVYVALFSVFRSVRVRNSLHVCAW